MNKINKYVLRIELVILIPKHTFLIITGKKKNQASVLFYISFHITQS